jgi:hypothetical protein
LCGALFCTSAQAVAPFLLSDAANESHVQILGKAELKTGRKSSSAKGSMPGSMPDQACKQ